MSPSNGVLLVISSGLQLYREYLVSAAAARARADGHVLHLINGTRPTWQRKFFDEWTVLNVFDHEKLTAAAMEATAGRHVAGLLCWDEPLVMPAAYIADRLGVPGLTVDGVHGCRDKHRTRRLLTAAGLHQPAFVMAADLDQARAAAAQIGYPVVVKPRALGASIGVVMAQDQAQLDAAFRVAEDAGFVGDEPFHGGALVEQYVAGPEISVDAAVHKGDYLPMYVARKQVTLQPYFEELGHIVEAADPLLADGDLIKMLAAAHRVLGVEYGITHAEVKLTDTGPLIVEVNGRLGGDLIPYLGKLATGIDPGDVLYDIGTGARPRFTAHRDRTVGIRFGYPPHNMVVESVTLPEPDPRIGLVKAAAMVDPGSELRLPPGGYIARHSFVICQAHDPRSCDQRLSEAASRVQVVGRQVPPPPPGTRFEMPPGLLEVDE